jgi:hypothetical protein
LIDPVSPLQSSGLSSFGLTGLTQQFETPNRELGFDFLIRVTALGAPVCARDLDFAAQELVIFSRLALTLNEFAHQFSYHLRRRSVGRLGLSHELVAQLGLEFHRKHGFFWHMGLLGY